MLFCKSCHFPIMKNGHCMHTALNLSTDEWEEWVANQKALGTPHNNQNQVNAKSQFLFSFVVCAIVVSLLITIGASLIW